MSDLKQKCWRCHIVHFDCPLCGKNDWSDSGDTHYCLTCSARLPSDMMDQRPAEAALQKRVDDLEEALNGCLRTAWHDDSCPAVDIDEHNRRNCNCGYLEASEKAQNLLNEKKGYK